MKVLAAIDHSVHGAAALDYLKAMPCSDAVDISLVSVSAVMPSYDVGGMGMAVESPEFMQQEIELLQARLDKLAHSIRDDFRSVQTHVSLGSAGREIVRLSKEMSSDLVLLGAVGHSAIARVLLGSVSDYVATHADCSTLVYRPPAEAAADASQAPGQESSEVRSPPRRVMIAISNNVTDDRLTAWIERLGLPVTTQIELVHVMEVVNFQQQDVLTKASAYWQEARSVAAKLIAKHEHRFQALGFETISRLLEFDHAGRALVDHAQSERCDLIIVGDQQETALERILLGSTSRHVLRHANVCVLISR
tara:strand:- start:150871 stop:151791 length:921 start_codon:yes stop_codon:yes gene_type:complete